MSKAVMFALYEYELRSISKIVRTEAERELFPLKQKRIKKTDVDKTPHEVFEAFFPSKKKQKMNIFGQKKVGRGKKATFEPDPHGNKTEMHRGNIVVLSVQENKKKKISKIDWKKGDVRHYPDFRVLIDFREDVSIIAIEKTSTTDPDEAIEMLTESFNQMLAQAHLTFRAGRLEKKASFWDAVNEIRAKLNDRIKRVSFDFSGDAATMDENDKSFVNRMLLWFKMMDASGSIDINLEDDEKLNMVKDDLEHMSEICMRNPEYSIMVSFAKFGAFKYGQDIKAQLGINEDIIDAFLVPAIANNLEDDPYQDKPLEDFRAWFDGIVKLFSRNEYGANRHVTQLKRNQEGRI